MTTIAPVATGSPQTVPARARDPREQWPAHARRLYDRLVALYGADDLLPTLAASWIAHQRSDNTQLAYARGLQILEEFAREHDAHPMGVTFPSPTPSGSTCRTRPPGSGPRAEHAAR